MDAFKFLQFPLYLLYVKSVYLQSKYFLGISPSHSFVFQLSLENSGSNINIWKANKRKYFNF